MLLTRSEEVVWKRDEALAEVSAALFVDLPSDAQSGEQVDAGHQKTGIMDHVHSQILGIKVIVKGCNLCPDSPTNARCK